MTNESVSFAYVHIYYSFEFSPFRIFGTKIDSLTCLSYINLIEQDYIVISLAVIFCYVFFFCNGKFIFGKNQYKFCSTFCSSGLFSDTPNNISTEYVSEIKAVETKEKVLIFELLSKKL